MSATPTPATIPAPAKPRRRWWRVAFAFVALVFIVLAAAYLYFDYAAKKAWDEAEAELDRTDPRWRLLEIDADRPVLADDENGALVIVAIAPKLDRAGLFYAAGKFEPAFEKLPPTARLNQQQIDLIKGEFAKLPEMQDVIAKLAKLPKGRFAVKHTDDWISRTMEEQQLTRTIVFWLKHDAYLAAENNEFDAALGKCRVMLHIGRMVATEFSLIEYLVRASHQNHAFLTLERILAQGEPSEEALVLVQMELEREVKNDGWFRALRAERAGIHHLMTNIRNGKVSGTRIGFSQHPKLGYYRFMYDRFPQTLVPHVPEALRVMTEAVEIAKLPIHARRSKLDPWEAKVRSSSSPVVLYLAPALTKTHDADCRMQARLRSAVVAMACERYRRTQKVWPASLEELVKAKLLDAVPADPIDNQPLRFLRLKDGIVIYSIGIDGIDNQGHIDHENWNAKGVDLGFRLWNPGARQQPPMPAVVENEEK